MEGPVKEPGVVVLVEYVRRPGNEFRRQQVTLAVVDDDVLVVEPVPAREDTQIREEVVLRRSELDALQLDHHAATQLRRVNARALHDDEGALYAVVAIEPQDRPSLGESVEGQRTRVQGGLWCSEHSFLQ